MTAQVAQVVLGVYVLLLAVGGVMGFVKAGSRPSLIAGLLSAVVAGVALFVSYRDEQKGFGLGLLLALVLLAMFARRFAKARKFMPSGLLCLASLAVVVVLSIALARSAA